MDRSWQDIAAEVKRHREDQGWLQEDVVERARVQGFKMSLSNYRVFESGGRNDYRPRTLRCVEAGIGLVPGSLREMRKGLSLAQALTAVDRVRQASMDPIEAGEDHLMWEANRLPPADRRREMRRLLLEAFDDLDEDGQLVVLQRAMRAARTLRRHASDAAAWDVSDQLSRPVSGFDPDD